MLGRELYSQDQTKPRSLLGGSDHTAGACPTFSPQPQPFFIPLAPQLVPCSQAVAECGMSLRA